MLISLGFFNNKHADERIERSRENIDSLDSKPNEIYQFELLRNEMIELEKRVQRSTDESVNEEVSSGQTFLARCFFHFDTLVNTNLARSAGKF